MSATCHWGLHSTLLHCYYNFWIWDDRAVTVWSTLEPHGRGKDNVSELQILKASSLKLIQRINIQLGKVGYVAISSWDNANLSCTIKVGRISAGKPDDHHITH